MDTAIKKAHEKISYISCNEETLRLYQMRELAQMDYNVGMKTARREGMQQGREEGREEGRQEALSEILQLFKEGKSIEEVSRLFNLSDKN